MHDFWLTISCVNFLTGNIDIFTNGREKMHNSERFLRELKKICLCKILYKYHFVLRRLMHSWNILFTSANMCYISYDNIILVILILFNLSSFQFDSSAMHGSVRGHHIICYRLCKVSILSKALQTNKKWVMCLRHRLTIKR